MKPDRMVERGRMAIVWPSGCLARGTVRPANADLPHRAVAGTPVIRQ